MKHRDKTIEEKIMVGQKIQEFPWISNRWQMQEDFEQVLPQSLSLFCFSVGI